MDAEYVSTVDCPRCEAPIPAAALNSPREVRCSSCRTPLRVVAFPALLRGRSIGSPGEALVTADDAGCFYHPDKRATVPCDGCGRFLCALCAIELAGRQICPRCIEAASRDGDAAAPLVRRRTLHGHVAVALALYPLVLWPMTLLTAPCTVGYVLMRWNAPGSLIQSQKPRLAAAMGFALLELGGWAWLISEIL